MQKVAACEREYDSNSFDSVTTAVAAAEDGIKTELRQEQRQHPEPEQEQQQQEQGGAKDFLLSSVTHVPSGLMGCALAD